MDMEKEPLVWHSPRQLQPYVRERSSTAEGKSWIVMTSLLVLGTRIGLQVDSLVFLNRAVSKNIVSSSFFGKHEFIYTEAYDIGCVAVSVGWIALSLIRYWCLRRELPADSDDARRVRIGNYLIYGLSFFALGGVFLAVMETMMFYSYKCATLTIRALTLMKIVFILSQVIFIFFSRYRKILSRNLFNGIFLFHTIVTNMIMYLRTIMQDKDNHFHRRPQLRNVVVTTQDCDCSTAPSPANETVECEFNNRDFFHAYMESNRFFSPFCLALALTASALFAELWLEQAPSKHHKQHQDQWQQEKKSIQHHNLQRGPIDNTTRSRQNGKLLGSVTSTCLLGFLILFSFLFMIMYEQYTDREESEHVYLIFQLSVASLLILLCLVGLVTLRWNDVSQSGISLDESLVF